MWQRCPAQTSGRLAAKDFVPSVSNASLHWDGSTGSLQFLIFLPNQPRQRPFYSRDGRGVGALEGPVFSEVSFEGSAIIRGGGSIHPLLQATPDMGRTRWILILCAWTIVGLLFAVRRIVLVKVQGSQDSWLIVGALELVYWYVWAAYTPLVIGLAKRFPLTGPRFVPHIAIHTITSLLMAPLASVTEYFLSRGLLRSVFRITDPGVLRFLSPFALSVLSMSFTGRVWLYVRDDGPGPAPGSRLRFGVGLTDVQSRLKQLYGDESSLELTGGNGRGCEAIITIPLRSSHEDASPHRR